MEDNKFLKARCKRTGIYYGLDLKKYGTEWKVVNMVRLSDEEASLTTSEIRQSCFLVNDNLLACQRCGKRVVGGCGCTSYSRQCSKSMPYRYDCIYCSELEIDYSRPSSSAVRGHQGDTVKLSQGKEVRIVTFSNVEWTKFDNINGHEDGRAAGFPEPTEHVIANEENIEFHGYNISKMEEGVFYTIGGSDDFDIECDVDTSTISPHPGGYFFVNFGAITARITERGGEFKLGGKKAAKVGSVFHMRLSLIGGCYEITIDGKSVGALRKMDQYNVNVIFGFAHDSHYCNKLSHAYMRGIQMRHGV